MPGVSVVIPAYNAETTIAETLESVLGQTYTDFEALVIDDGSVDGTAAVACASADSRVRVISIANGGVSQARNRGIAEARAELIAFLDADDLWEPEKLDRQVVALGAAPHAGLCVTAALRIDARGQILSQIPLLETDDVCETLLLNAMAVGCISSGLVRTEVLNAIGGFDARFSQCADWDLWLRIAATSAFCLIDLPLVRYRTAAGNMSSDVDLLERDTFAVLDAFFSSPLAARYGSIRSRVYGRSWMMCSGSYFGAGQLGDALRCGLHGTLAHPPSLRRAVGMPLRQARRLRARPRGA